MKVTVKRVYNTAEERQALADIDVGLAIIQSATADYCQGLTTDQLERICRVHAHTRNDDLIPFEFLMAVMAELVRRYQQFDATITRAAQEWEVALLQTLDQRSYG